MMTKATLLLSALTLCCCIASLQAFPRERCMCIQTISSMPVRVIKRIEVIPISGYCRRTEIIVTRRNGSQVCVNPAANWVYVLISNLKS
ncbi:growth-regulated alpha protein-like [Gymnodraco acuticeps]|uniref:C-X-C motif chemokine n=1 Tax=Gymnodraco acuticeps TaxID=8218 RepID=A0A6P8U707_GYMAC|nr:growth-regulated alpha protein-like [Gymnodraco acuticeps]